MKMADQLKIPMQKRQHESDHVLEQERQKQAGNATEENLATDETTITNINYDCLERIFNFLDLESLMMVAQTCKRLQIAAAAKFGHDFADKFIRLCPSQNLSWNKSNNAIRILSTSIEIIGWKFCFQFLRCFGAKVSYLVLDYKLNTMQVPIMNVSIVRVVYLDGCINQFCNESLTKFIIRGKKTFSMKNLELKPFKNVTELLIQSSHSKNELPEFLKLFPNLRRLEMYCINLYQRAPMDPIPVSIPHLEHLVFEIDVEFGFTKENADNLLHANQQLKSLEIYCDNDMTWGHLLKILSKNVLISKLKIGGEWSQADMTTIELNRFVNEHSLIEEMHFISYVIRVDTAINIIRQLNSLKLFTLCMKERSECDRLLNQLDSKWQYRVFYAYSRIRISLSRRNYSYLEHSKS